MSVQAEVNALGCGVGCIHMLPVVGSFFVTCLPTYYCLFHCSDGPNKKNLLAEERKYRGFQETFLKERENAVATKKAALFTIKKGLVASTSAAPF